MRKTLCIAAALTLAVSALALPPRQVITSDGPAVAGAPWVTHALGAPIEVGSLSQSVVATNRPIVLLETNYYTFTPGSTWHLRLTADPNGWDAPATMYLYWQDRVSGAKLFYNIPNGGLYTDGTVADLFGTPGAPIAINVPKLTDFVLFGTASDTAGWGLAGALGAGVTVPALPAGPAANGRYQYVVEIRDGEGKTVISRTNAMYSFVTQNVNVTADVTANTTWAADNTYVLGKAVFVRAPATLTIQPGTVVIGTQAGGTSTALVIERGAKLIADGRRSQPIIFTSDQKVGERARADWGGLIINGRAPINTPGGEAPGEGDTGLYGGGATPNADDNSGVLRYVRVEWAGNRITPENELNGIAFQGVGRGTTVDYIQVHYNQDDMIEFFGGTVDAKHVLMIGGGDDNADWVEGWTGKLQWLVAIQERVLADNGDNGIEADNKSGNNDLEPRSNPQVYNMTYVGAGSASPTANYGALLREGTAGKIYNSAFVSTKRKGSVIRNNATFTQANSGSLIFDYNLFYANGGYGSSDDAAANDTFFFTTMKNNRTLDPMFAINPITPIAQLMPDVTPTADSPLLDVNFIKTPPDDGFFDTDVSCAGGVCPGDNWVLSGWALFGDN